jgi:hypothetical protein
MPRIFVATIADQNGKADLERSVTHAVERTCIIDNFSDATYPELVDIERRGRGFYAWGLEPDPENVKNWFEMGSGDLVLLTYDGAYRHYAKVLGRYESQRVADAIWGSDGDTPGQGEKRATREYLFFMSEPVSLEMPCKELDSYLPASDAGFSQVPEDVIKRIESEFGTVERFARRRLLNTSVGGPVLDMSGMIRVSESELAKLRKFDTESRKQGVANIIETILKRRGDPQFRRTLLEAYDGRCAITNFNALDSLEAAYIVPFRGKHTNEPSNGLLLRSDIHTLFDVGKLAIDTLTMTVILADDMIHTSYRILAGRPLRYPEEPSQRPDTDSLDLHRRLAGL